MNNRIRELAEQAGFQFWEDEPWNPGDIIDWSCRYDDEFKKFAELIVRECAKVAFNDWCDGTNEGSSQMAILKHFGVE